MWKTCNIGQIPWRRAWQPIPVFLPGESPRTEEPGRLQFMGSQKVRHNWMTKHSTDLRKISLSSGCWQNLVLCGCRTEVPALRSHVYSLSHGSLSSPRSTGQILLLGHHCFAFSLSFLRICVIRLGWPEESRIISFYHSPSPWLGPESPFCHVREHIHRFWELEHRHTWGAIILHSTDVMILCCSQYLSGEANRN